MVEYVCYEMYNMFVMRCTMVHYVCYEMYNGAICLL